MRARQAGQGGLASCTGSAAWIPAQGKQGSVHCFVRAAREWGKGTRGARLFLGPLLGELAVPGSANLRTVNLCAMTCLERRRRRRLSIRWTRPRWESSSPLAARQPRSWRSCRRAWCCVLPEASSPRRAPGGCHCALRRASDASAVALAGIICACLRACLRSGARAFAAAEEALSAARTPPPPLAQDLSWAQGKKFMGNVDSFLRLLTTFDKDNVPGRANVSPGSQPQGGGPAAQHMHAVRLSCRGSRARASALLAEDDLQVESSQGPSEAPRFNMRPYPLPPSLSQWRVWTGWSVTSSAAPPSSQT